MGSAVYDFVLKSSFSDAFSKYQKYNIEFTELNIIILYIMLLNEKLFNAAQFGNLRQKLNLQLEASTFFNFE